MEIKEVKVLLKELSKKVDREEFMQACTLCSEEQYLNSFPEISSKSFLEKLTINDYENYILNTNEPIEERYARYWCMMFEIMGDKDFDKNNKNKILYSKLLEETLSLFDTKSTINVSTDVKRLYIFTNQYLPNSQHSPSLVVNKFLDMLEKIFDVIFVISNTPYPHPYPEKEYKFFNYSGLEENNIYSLREDVYLIEFRGFLDESLYFDFIDNQNLNNSDKFLLIGHSNLHFDIISSEKKIVSPTALNVIELSTATSYLSPIKREIKNIYEKEMNFIEATSDFTQDVENKFLPKEISKDEIVNIAIVGNRLDAELNSDFFDSLVSIYKVVPNVRFIIIGTFTKENIIPSIICSICKLVGIQKDLSDYYKEHIHFFLNPHRLGGGQSAVISIKMGIPVLTLEYGDVYTNLYHKYSLKTLEEAGAFVNKYIKEEEFKKKIDQYNKEIIDKNKSLLEKSIKSILET